MITLTYGSGAALGVITPTLQVRVNPSSLTASVQLVPGMQCDS